jgi:hypothetical protein
METLMVYTQFHVYLEGTARSRNHQTSCVANHLSILVGEYRAREYSSIVSYIPNLVFWYPHFLSVNAQSPRVHPSIFGARSRL